MLKKLAVGMIFLLCLVAQQALADDNNPPMPAWAKKLISKTDFSFFEKARKWTFQDFDYYEPHKGREEAIPGEVREVLGKEAKGDFKNFVAYELGEKAEENEIPNPKDTYTPIYVFDGPGPLKVYALHVEGWGMPGDFIGNSYCFVLNDPGKKICSKPIWIPTRWGDIGSDRTDLPPTAVKPLIEITDSFGCGTKTFVVEDIRHNGTSTGVLYHHYEIEPNLGLADVLDLETRLTDTGEWWNKGYTEIDRKIVGHSGNQITVELTLEGLGLPVIGIGSMVLEREGPYTPFKIAKKIKKNPDPFFDEFYYLGKTQEWD